MSIKLLTHESTSSFPIICLLLSQLILDSIILDGEMLVWDPVSERNLPFGTLKTAALGSLKLISLPKRYKSVRSQINRRKSTTHAHVVRTISNADLECL